MEEFLEEPSSGPIKVPKAARDRIQRKKDRLAAEAQAKAEAEGLTPSSSTNPSIPQSTTLDSLTFSASSSTSGFQYPQPSSSAFQLSLPGPLTPLHSIYSGIADDTPPLPQGHSALGLTTSASATGSGFGSASLQQAGDSRRPVVITAQMTASERRRAKEAAGEAIGLEDEIEWGYEEETMGDNPIIPPYPQNAPPLPPKTREEEEYAREMERRDAQRNKAERQRMEELSKKLSGARSPEMESGGSASESGSMRAGFIPGEGKKGSRWNPHAHGTKKDEGGSAGFQLLRPEGTYKEIGIDAQFRKDKKREDRKEMVGRFFGKKSKGGEGRKREAWEDELEGLSRAESGSKEQSLRPSTSLPTSSKVSLPSSSSQPVRSILKQPGQPSRRILPSFTAPSLSSLAEDPARPSPATQTTALSSISGLPSSSFNIQTPYGEPSPLPSIPTSTGKTKARPDTADTITPSMYGPNQSGLPPLTRPFGQAMSNEANMDRRPSLASSTAGSMQLSSRNDTQTSLDSSSGLFYSAPTQSLGPALGLPDTSPQTRKKPGIFAALTNRGQGSSEPRQDSSGKTRVFPLPPTDDSSPSHKDDALLLAPLPSLDSRNQDSRYPDLSPPSALGLLPSSFSLPSVSLLGLPQGFNAARRPSDTAVHVAYGPPSPRSEPDVRATRRRSASETRLLPPGSNYIVPPSSRYVPPRRPRTGDSNYSALDTSVGSPDSFTSLASITRESLGVSGPSTEPVRRISGKITTPIYGIPSTILSGSASTNYLPLPPPPRIRQQYTIPPPQPVKSAPGFFARNASVLSLALLSQRKREEETIVEHFASKDPAWPTIGFRIENMGREKHMETYFPPSKSSSRELLPAMLPLAPTSLGRIESVRLLQATVMIRIHPRPEDGDGERKSGKSRPSTAVSLAPALKSLMGGSSGSSRPGTAVSLAPTSMPMYDEDDPRPVSNDQFHHQWKRMILVLTSFSFDSSDDGPQAGSQQAKTHKREPTVGPERSVAHLHLFDPSPAMSPTKRPKTSDTFGPPAARPFGASGYIPESEKLEYDRRALRAGCMVVLGDIVDLGYRPDEVIVEGETREQRMERRTRKDVVWFGWGEGEGWHVQFKDREETDLWLKDARIILRRMGREDLTSAVGAPYALLREYDARQAQLAAQVAEMKERFLSPEDHIARHISAGHSIWDPRTNPPVRTVRGTMATPAEYDPSPAGRWLRYEHPALRPMREKDKLETFDQLAFGRVGWRDWIWPVPPGKERNGRAKAAKRAAGKKRRRRKLRVKKALSGGRKKESKGKTRMEGEVGTPRAAIVPRQAMSPGTPEGTELPLVLSDHLLLGRQLDTTPTAPSSSRPTLSGSATATPRSPLRPLLLSAEPSKSIVLPRQSSSRSIAPSVISTRSTASAQSGTSGNTVRSAQTFGRPPSSVSPVASVRPLSSVGAIRTRPGTGSRNLPPPSLPPPSTPLPAPPIASSAPTVPLPLPPRSAGSSLSSYSSAETGLGGQENTPKAHTLGLFPAPPTTTPPSAGSGQGGISGLPRSRPSTAGPPVTPVFGSTVGIASARRAPSSTGPSAYPAQLASSQASPTPYSFPAAVSSASTSSLPYRQDPPTTRPLASQLAPTPVPAGGNWYAGTAAGAASSISLVSDSSGRDSTSTSMTSGGTGPSGRRRRMMTPVVDLAGEINAIDAARAAELRAEAAAAGAEEEEPVDDNRPRVIRFA